MSILAGLASGDRCSNLRLLMAVAVTRGGSLGHSPVIIDLFGQMIQWNTYSQSNAGPSTCNLKGCLTRTEVGGVERGNEAESDNRDGRTTNVSRTVF
jgi:hypothetical protein